MPARRLLVRKIREVFRLKHERGLSHRAIAQACAIGVGTVSLYLQRTAQQGLGWPPPTSSSAACHNAELVMMTNSRHSSVRTAVREFSALPDGLRAMTDWLRGHGVTVATMEGTGVYWKAPFEALEEAGIHADLLHAQHVKQIRGKKTDTNDSRWLARICQFGLALPSYIPPRLFRQVRQLTRYRRRLVGERSRARNRVHKTLDHDGLRLGGVLSDIFGVNGRRVLDGLVAERTPRCILVVARNPPRWIRMLTQHGFLKEAQAVRS